MTPRQINSARLLASAALLAAPTSLLRAGALSGDAVYLTTEHVDLNVGYNAGSNTWSLGPRVESIPAVEYAGEDAVLYVHPLALQSSTAALNFTGAAPGQDIYILPQSGAAKLLYLGTSGYGASSSNFDRWSPATESKGRLTGLGRYLRMGLSDVKGPGEFSLWSTGAFGDLTPYMTTYNDGVANPNGAGLDFTDGITSDDALWLLTNGHVHYNFGFTKPGLYEVRVNTEGHLDIDANPNTVGPRISSAQPFSVYFNVHPNYAKAGLIANSALPSRGTVVTAADGLVRPTSITSTDYGRLDISGAADASSLYVLLDLADPTLAGAVKVALSGFTPPPDTGLGAGDEVAPVAIVDPDALDLYENYTGGTYDLALRYEELPAGGTFDFEFDFRSILDGVSVTNIGVVAPPLPQWGTTSGDWNIAGNWTNGMVPNGAGAQANLLALVGGPKTITLNTAATVGKLKFDNASAYIIAGSGSLTLNATSGNARIQVVQGSHQIGVPLTVASDSTIDVATGAHLNISGPVTVNAGKTLTSSRTSVVRFASPVTLQSNARIDLKDGKLIFANQGAGSWNGSSYTGITGLIASGRNDGVWNGPGITTSMTEATNGSSYTMLGVVTAAESGRSGSTFAGVTIGANDTLVMYTYGGDADLSGAVDIDDYGLIDFNASTGGALTGWYNGDFDYNGIQDIDDYGIIDFVVNIQGPPFSAAGAPSITAVPEPSFVAVIPAAAGILLRRRRIARTRPQEGGGPAKRVE